MDALQRKGTQQELGDLVGISQARVSQLMAEGVLPAGTLLEQLHAYTSWLREQAAGRASADGGLDLVQERAALAREQRISYEIKNAVARGEYAPIGLLADVLGQASAAVVDRFDQLPSLLRKACPDLPAEARDAIAGVIARARNQWIKSTAELVVRNLEEMTDEQLDVPEAEEGADA
jgi:phage terminase Nu1 subunit (DNA packaging protein)